MATLKSILHAGRKLSPEKKSKLRKASKEFQKKHGRMHDHMNRRKRAGLRKQPASRTGWD